MSKVPTDVTESLDKITKYLDSSGKDVRTVVDGMKKHFESESRSAKLNAVCSSIKKIGNSIDSIKSGDVTKKLSSVLDITASISEIIREDGQLISALCALFSAVLGTIGSEGGKSMASVVKEVIEKALGNYEDSELRAMVEGTTRVYRDSLAYLNFDVGTILTEGEVTSLHHVPIYTGIKMLGILANKVNENAKKKDLTQGKRAIAYTNLYVKLAILRSLIFMQMQTLIKGSGQSQHIVDAFKRMAHTEEETDKEFIKYLTTPTYDKAYLFVQLSPTKEPLLSAFLCKHGLHFQNLEQLAKGAHIFRPKEWIDWGIGLRYKVLGANILPDRTCLILKGEKPFQEKFYIETINGNDSLFHIRSQQGPNWYVYMKNDLCFCQKEKQGSQSEWKIIQFEDGKYMLSTIERPDRFVYMDWASDIKGWEGDPGPQGHWQIS